MLKKKFVLPILILLEEESVVQLPVAQPVLGYAPEVTVIHRRKHLLGTNFSSLALQSGDACYSDWANPCASHSKRQRLMIYGH